jgi:hypothetical protein
MDLALDLGAKVLKTKGPICKIFIAKEIGSS